MQTAHKLLSSLRSQVGIEIEVIIEEITVTRTCLGKAAVALVASAFLKSVYAELIWWITRKFANICFLFF